MVLNPQTMNNCYLTSMMSRLWKKIIQTQGKIVKYLKDNNHTHIYHIWIIIDDFADSPEVSRNSKILHSLYTRGRHHFISTLISTQGYKAISPIIRKNITDVFLFRLRNHSELEAVVDEITSVVDKK